MKKAFTLMVLASLCATLTAANAQTAPATPAAAPAQRPAEQLISMCMGCHNIIGYQADFPEVYKVPMIAGQGAKYIVSALTAYRKGDRKHPTMHAVAGSLTDGDIAAIANYYEALGKKGEQLPPVPATLSVTPGPEVQALLTKGNCVACHGANLDKPLDPTYPKLSGQHPDYLYAALKAYQTDGNPHVGRNNAIMSAQARLFNHAELKELANYIGSLPTELKTVPESRFR